MTIYVDKDRNECVKKIFDKETPATTITLPDIIGDVGDVIEPDISTIFCEPFLNYHENYAANNFDYTLRVTNSNADTWTAAYTPGFTDADGLAIWTKCHALWLKYGQIEKPPSNKTDLKWIRNYADAVWAINDWIDSMDKKRIPLSVQYDKAIYWLIFQHVNLTLPHQTNASPIECTIEEIKKDKKSGKVDLQLIFLDEIPTSFFDYINETGSAMTTIDENGSRTDTIDEQE